MSSIRLSLSPTEYLTLDQHAFFNGCPEVLDCPVPSLLFAIGRTACRWTSVLLDPSLDLLIAVLQKVFSQMYILRNKKIPIACRLYGWAKSLVERHELLFRMCCSDMWGTNSSLSSSCEVLLLSERRWHKLWCLSVSVSSCRLPWNSRAVETCSLVWQIILLCQTVWWSSLVWVVTRRTTLVWLHCAKSNVWWRGS